MLKKILFGLAIIIIVFAGVIAMQPSKLHVARSASISAPPSVVFAQVNDFHNWEAWSPWVKLDPNAKNSYEGAPSGEGSIFRWAGNMEVGVGSMTITQSCPDEQISIRLDFLKPFKATNAVEFTFKPEGDHTLVTWSMSGPKNFMAKAIGLFMNCEKMCGDSFEKGLAQMKTVAEAASKK